MELVTLQKEMVAAMKAGDKIRKDVLSSIVSAVKKNAIDKGCRDNISESLVLETLLKEKKTVQEMIDTCPDSREDLKTLYSTKMSIIDEYCPSLIEDKDKVMELIMEVIHENDYAPSKKNKGKIMKLFVDKYKGKVNMRIVSTVIDEVLG